jgi:hypothetical protein
MTTATLPVRARRSGDAGTRHGSAGAATTPTAAEATVTEPMIWAADAGWKDDFRRLWAALGVSLLGLEVTAFALPLTAALVLGATPLQMGLLAAAGQAPFLLLSLPAGAWVDRRRRRPLLIASDLG